MVRPITDEPQESRLRKIIHIDMDAFYASVEQRDHPAYQGKPIVVGGRPEQRGAVAAASYEAREYGIHSALPARIAQQRCPHLIFVPPRFTVYRQISQHIREIFGRYTDCIEPLALDEAYLDVTDNKLGAASAMAMARAIRRAIYQETQLTASAGVSFNKFLAKIASGMNKPDGLYVIRPEQAADFVAALPIEKFHGIGKVTATKMHHLGIHTGADLRQWQETDLVQQFGKVGRFYYRVAQGQDDRPVNPNRVRKSVGAETSFAEDLRDLAEMEAVLAKLAQQVAYHLEKQQRGGYTLTLKVKYANYRQVTRSQTQTQALREAEALMALGQKLLHTHLEPEIAVRLLGLTVSNLEPLASQLEFVQLQLDL
ncbi:MAG: DNA polymerase IV [Leptolyngbya sp. RL_3_1]|nr:DNA polymerase IV [Leptolyngbya sp. RL_3_1]